MFMKFLILIYADDTLMINDNSKSISSTHLVVPVHIRFFWSDFLTPDDFTSRVLRRQTLLFRELKKQFLHPLPVGFDSSDFNELA